MELLINLVILVILSVTLFYILSISNLTTIHQVTNGEDNVVKLPDKIAVIMHVGNMKVFEEILIDYPNFFNNSQIDLYFSCNNIETLENLEKLFPESKVFKFENKGMDIGPFLLIIEYLIQNNADYKYYIKLHTKSIKHWRDELILPLYNKLNYVLNDNTPPKTVQLYGSEKRLLNEQFEMNYTPVLNIIGRNYKKYESKFLKYCSKIRDNNDDCELNPSFIAGTIFMFNNKYFDLFKEIKDIKYEYSILEPGYIINDKPRNTHAWEYLFGYLVYLNNEKIITI